MTTATRPHPFEPRYDGKGCRHYTYADHRAIECGAEATASVHTGTRAAPPELEFPYPPCSICGRDTYHDGDGFRCDPCGAYWGGNGPGSWDDPEMKVCLSTFKPFDRPDLESKHENIRHHLAHCTLTVDHDGKHRTDEFTTWTDDQAVPS